MNEQQLHRSPPAVRSEQKFRGQRHAVMHQPKPTDEVPLVSRDKPCALGQKQTFTHLLPMSALPPKADIGYACWNVRIWSRLRETVRFTMAGTISSRCSFVMVFALAVVTTVRTRLLLRTVSIQTDAPCHRAAPIPTLAQKRDLKDTRVRQKCKSWRVLGHKSPMATDAPQPNLFSWHRVREFSWAPRPIAQAVLMNAAGWQSWRQNQKIGSTFLRWPRHGTCWPSSAQAIRSLKLGPSLTLSLTVATSGLDR